jgi:cell division protein ZapA
MADKSSLVHVEIFGQTYALRGGDDPAYIERLAGYVDSQMREVGKMAGAVDSVRIAVLAALNIADECLKAKDAETGSQALGQRAASLARELDAVLAE